MDQFIIVPVTRIVANPGKPITFEVAKKIYETLPKDHSLTHCSYIGYAVQLGQSRWCVRATSYFTLSKGHFHLEFGLFDTRHWRYVHPSILFVDAPLEQLALTNALEYKERLPFTCIHGRRFVSFEDEHAVAA